MSASEKQGNPKIKPFWSPLAAGIALGLVLLLTFVLSGHGLGASGAATDMVAGVGLKLAPEATKANGYLGPMVADGSPMGSWMTWEILGVAIGALVAAFMAGRFRVQFDGSRSIGTPARLISTLAGGVMAGFGARIAGGCTSGLGLSGAAALGISAFVFLALFFATGMIVSRLVKGV
ncbi:MAG: YeeE/YedE thiosulfate transporter family protein [Rhodocyclales bacterium]|nr:YeeE/YedE thiosulfate transporter family protein [Rhodocyclales bacterium]